MFVSWLRQLMKGKSWRSERRLGGVNLVLEALEDRRVPALTPTITPAILPTISLDPGIPLVQVPISFTNVGFQQNVVATLIATYASGQPDTTPGDFTGTIQWGDGQTSAASFAPVGGSSNTLLVKGSNVYHQPNAEDDGYQISVQVTGMGITKPFTKTATAVVLNLLSNIPTIQPPPTSQVTPRLQQPSDVDVFLNPGIPGYVNNSYVNDGFEKNVVAALSGTLNGAPDTTQGDFHAWINWGDSNQWDLADIAPNTDGTVDADFLVKGSHTYTTTGSYDVTVYAIGPDGTSISDDESCRANVYPFSPTLPPPQPVVASLPPSNVTLALDPGIPEYQLYPQATVGFQNVVLASLDDNLNGQPDNTLADSTAYVNYGDGSPWVLANLVPTNNQSSAQFDVEGSHAYTQPGKYNIVAYAVGPDGTTETAITATATVSPVPVPVLASMSAQDVQEGNPLSVPILATPGDASQTLTYSLDSGAPAGVAINAQTGLLTWTPQPLQGQLPGNYSLTVNVAVNGAPQLNATATFTITVTDVADPGAGFDAWQTVANGLTHSAEYYTNIITVAYQKYLGRTPDANGLAYWVNQMQQGLSDEQLEAGFIGSEEYIADHGGAGQNWVIGLYKDLLGRAPGADEVAYWVTNLNNGMSPQEVAFGFAASAEREGQRVTADYQQYLGRDPSSTEVTYWVNAFLSGMDNESVVAGFVGSQETFQSQGSNNVHDWLFVAYKEILNRPPDASGAQSWLGVLGG